MCLFFLNISIRHQTHGAEMSWVRSVLGPTCPYTLSSGAASDDSPPQSGWRRPRGQRCISWLPQVCTSGNFVKLEQLERWRAKRKSVPGSKLQGQSACGCPGV